MMTLARIRSVTHAATYFEQSDHADYYTREETCPSFFAGKAAVSLGVDSMPVTQERFSRYLRGEVAGQQLGTKRNGKIERNPGTDCVLSPPKSVSLAALVGGDDRAIEAHHQAVKSAIAELEKHAAYTRKHTLDEYGRDKIEHVHTGNLLCAVFTHDSSRSLQPQLHSHVVVINATEVEEGKWGSLESRHLYCMQKKIGLYYRQQLAANLKNLGYEISRTADANFEIAGYSEKVTNEFSSRRDAIDHALEEKGLTRDTASAALKQKLSRDLREKNSVLTPVNCLINGKP